MKIKSILAGLVLALTSAASAGIFEFTFDSTKNTTHSSSGNANFALSGEAEYKGSYPVIPGHETASFGREGYLIGGFDYTDKLVESATFTNEDLDKFAKSHSKISLYTRDRNKVHYSDEIGDVYMYSRLGEMETSYLQKILSHLSVGESWEWKVNGYGSSAFTFTALPAPEPTSGLMLLFGAGMLALRRKRLPAA